MKKIASLTMVVILLLSIFTFNVSAQNNVSVYIEGEKVEFDVQPQVISGRTMVPMRKIFEQLGATVEWEQTTQTITGKKEDTTIIMQIDNNELSVNDNVSTLDVAPIVVNGRTLVPVRAIAESFGIDVLWYGDIEAVAIYSDKDSIGKKNFYNLKGDRVEIDVNFEENYLALGWTTEMQVTMYAPDGRTTVVANSEVSAYQNVGWYSYPVTTMYAADGRTTVVASSEVSSYQNVGWYSYPVTTIYAADGRTMVVGQDEVYDYINVGWYRTYEEAQAANAPSYSSGTDYKYDYNDDYNSDSGYDNQPNSGGSAVYRTPSGKRYHFDSNCGGKNSFETTLQKAKNAGLTPCQKCAW